MIRIRNYEEQDYNAVKRCFSILQDYEREFEPLRMPSAEMADVYLANIFSLMQKHGGKIFLSVLEDSPEQITGFICVLGNMDFDPELNCPAKSAYVTDLVVDPSYRKMGAAQALMRKAEEYAKNCGAIALFLEVLAGNHLAREFYTGQNYGEYQLRLRKDL